MPDRRVRSQEDQKRDNFIVQVSLYQACCDLPKTWEARTKALLVGLGGSNPLVARLMLAETHADGSWQLLGWRPSLLEWRPTVEAIATRLETITTTSKKLLRLHWQSPALLRLLFPEAIRQCAGPATMQSGHSCSHR